MSFYGLATAITGKRENPLFHCNVLKLNAEETQQSFPRREDPNPPKKDYKQPRLTKEAKFERIPQLSFCENLEPENPEQIKKIAKRFLDTVTQTIKLQRQSKTNPQARIQVIVGQDGRNGMDYYPRKNLRETFARSDPNKVSELLAHCQFHLGSFSVSQLGNPRIKREAQEDTERTQWLAQTKAILDIAQGEDREAILEELKEYARDHAGREMYRFAATNMRFFGFSSTDDSEYDFSYLNWDPEIERAFIDAVRLFYLVIYPKDQRKKATDTLYHMHMKIDDSRHEPFIDVLKTYLLDLLAESEDGKNRISNQENKYFQKQIREYLSQLKPTQQRCRRDLL